MDANERAAHVLRSHRLIMAAVGAGRISPGRAVYWARRAARGESVAHLASLAPGPVRAASPDPALAQRILDVLTEMLTRMGGGGNKGPAEYQAVYPGADNPLGPWIFPGQFEGRPDRPRERMTWSGYSTYASGPPAADDDVYGAVYGRLSLGEVEAREVQASADVAALTDEELHERLFGKGLP